LTAIGAYRIQAQAVFFFVDNPAAAFVQLLQGGILPSDQAPKRDGYRPPRAGNRRRGQNQPCGVYRRGSSFLLLVLGGMMRPQRFLSRESISSVSLCHEPCPCLKRARRVKLFGLRTAGFGVSGFWGRGLFAGKSSTRLKPQGRKLLRRPACARVFLGGNKGLQTPIRGHSLTAI